MKVSDIMTNCPYKVEASMTIEKAFETMQLYKIRHLPVIEQNDLIGLVTLADLKLAQVICTTMEFCPNLGELCHQEPVIVSEDLDLPSLAARMAEEHLDSVLVENNSGELVGIVTNIDLYKTLQRVLAK